MQIVSTGFQTTDGTNLLERLEQLDKRAIAVVNQVHELTHRATSPINKAFYHCFTLLASRSILFNILQVSLVWFGLVWSGLVNCSGIRLRT